jgi:hypothetical protein
MAKAPTAMLLAAAAIYSRQDALNDSAVHIEPVETGDPAVILTQIVSAIQDAATGRGAESIHIRQRDPVTGIVSPIPSNHANWITIRQTLRNAPYEFIVDVRPSVGDIEVKWAS